MVTPAGVLTPSGSFAADPLLQYAILSNVKVPCVGIIPFSNAEVSIQQIVWSDVGRLENRAGPAFVGLRRAQIAKGTILGPGPEGFNRWDDTTSTAELLLGLVP